MIMLPWDPSGKTGPKHPLPDHICVIEPKEDVPRSETQAMLNEAAVSAKNQLEAMTGSPGLNSPNNFAETEEAVRVRVPSEVGFSYSSQLLQK